MPYARSHQSAAMVRPTARDRKPANLSLPVDLIDEARSLGINLSQAAASGIAAAITQHRQARWVAENQDALQSSNAFVEQNGLPLDRYRHF